MPLHTQIIRNGEPREIPGGWSYWHLNKVLEAIDTELGDEEAATKAFQSGEYRFKEPHIFEEFEQLVWTRGGEPGTMYTFSIQPGDVFRAWHGRH